MAKMSYSEQFNGDAAHFCPQSEVDCGYAPQSAVQSFSGAPVVLGDFTGIRVGRDIDDAATRDFAGHLDDFRIYGRALAVGESLGLAAPVSTV